MNIRHLRREMLFRKSQKNILKVIILTAFMYAIVEVMHGFIQHTESTSANIHLGTPLPTTQANVTSTAKVSKNQTTPAPVKQPSINNFKAKNVNNKNFYSEYNNYFNAFPESSINDTFTNNHEFKYSMSVEQACSAMTLICTIVHTAPNNAVKRDLIRQTWGAYKSHDVIVARPVFLLGQVTNETLQKLLQEESQTHRDIVQGNFLDSYKNLTYKNIMGLHWVIHFCNQSKYVLKVDDDVIVNMDRLVKFLLAGTFFSTSELQNKIRCSVFVRGKAHRKDGGWIVSSAEYPYTYYPTYCQGYAYVMTLPVVRRLHEASKTVKHLWIDDIYVTGLLTAKSGIVVSPFPKGASGGNVGPTVKSSLVRMHAFFVCRKNEFLVEWKRIWDLMKAT